MANYWDTIKQAIASSLGQAISKPIENIASGFVSSTAGKIAPGADTSQVAAAAAKPIQEAGQKAGKVIVGAATKPAELIKADNLFNLGMQEADAAYSYLWPKVTQPITTAILASQQLQQGQLPNVAEDWKLAKEVSPGQAFISPVVELINSKFNLADPTDRKETFTNNVFGKTISGGVDGLLNWYVDPLVIGGKTAKVAREAVLINPIKSADDIVRLRKDLDAHNLYMMTDGKAGRETPIGTAVQSLVGKSPVEVFDHPLVKRSTNPTLLAGLIGEAKTYDDAADFIAAAAGDRASLDRIAQSRASIADEIQRSQDLLDPVAKKYANIEWGAGANINNLEPTIQEYDRLNKVLEDLKARDENLARAMDERLGDYRVIRDYTAAADVNLFDKNIGVAVEKARARAAELAHDFSFYTETFQKTPFSRPVSVIQAAFNKLPRGLVRIDGGPVADSANEIKYALNSVPVLRNPEYLAKKTELFSEYALAKNSSERFNAVKNIEEEVANIIALENNISLDEARYWYNSYGSVRKGIMDSMSSQGFWVGDDGGLITSPFWKSEMPNVVPMMDFKDFDGFLKLYKRLAPSGMDVTQFGLKARQATKELEDITDFANSLFKASVLTRMGYPIRNTLDGQLRAALTLGSIAKADEVFKTFKENLATRAQRATNFFNETVTSTRPDQLNTEIGKLIQQRSNVIDVRDSILDELTPKQYYANAAGTFGKQVTPDMVELGIASKTKPLLKDSEKSAYFELMQKRKDQKGLLFGKDKTKFEDLQHKAFSKYVREEVVPTLPKGTTLVYADYPSGKVFYKIPGSKGRLPRAATPEIQARRAVPSSMLADELESNGLINLRGKGPIEHPDIRVVTSYEVSRGRNYEDIKDLIGEDQMLRLRTYQNMADKMDNEILDKVAQSQKLAERRAELKIIKTGEKDEIFISPTGKKVVADGAFAGPNGALVRAEASSEGSLNWVSENQAYLSFDAAKGARSTAQGMALSDKRIKVEPGDPQYFNEMSVFANRILRNDQLAMQILEGKQDRDIIQWLKSEKGSFYLREINADVSKTDIPAHVAEARSRIYKLFPDQQVRSLIAREELSPEQFDLLMRGTPNLIPIAGRALVEDGLRYNAGTIKRAVNNTVSKLFKVIGSTPENNLVAWPFYNNLYKQNLKLEIDLAEGMGKNIQDPDLIIQMQRSAHAASQKTLNEVMYRIANNTGMSNLMRFMVPFFNAQYNAVKVYGKFLIEDPSRIARANLAWNLPNRVATVIDNDGNAVAPGQPPSVNQYLIFTIPAGIQGRFGIPKGYQISIPKNSLNVFLTGDNPLMPSFGIPVTLPLSELANSRPDTAENFKTFLTEFFGPQTSNAIMNSVLPFGKAPANPWMLLLPAAAQKELALQQGLDNVSYGISVSSAMKSLRYQWEQNGSVGKQPNFQDAVDLANKMWKIRIAANLSLPFTFTFRPEWQPIVDDYRKAMLDPNIGKDKVDDYILDKYGPIGFILNAPTGKNVTGVNYTASAVTNSKKYKSLLGEMDKGNTPGLIGFITNFNSNNQKYSDMAANYFRNRDVRPNGNIKYTETRAIEDVITDREVSLGWNYYQKFAKQRDAVLAQYGIKDINSSAAQAMGLTAKWNAAVESIKNYLPTWATAYEDSVADTSKTRRYVKGLIKVLGDKTWMDQNGTTPTMQAVSDYVLNRDYLAKELANRKKYLGTSGLADPANADLKEKWDDYILKLKLYDPSGFGELYTRYLENDKYDVIEVNK